VHVVPLRRNFSILFLDRTFLVSKISVFQDVWMQKGLITVLDYNNFYVIIINHYASDILMAY